MESVATFASNNLLIMEYCPNGVNLSMIWIDHGINPCFFDTFSSALMLLFTFTIVLGQLIFHLHNGQSIPPELITKSKLHNFQIFLHLILIIMPMLTLAIFSYEFPNLSQEIHGHQILMNVSQSVVWIIALSLMIRETKIRATRHSIALLIFWALQFVLINLALVSVKSELWWFTLNSYEDRVKFGLYLFQYVCLLVIFLLGLKAPGLVRGQIDYEDLIDPDSDMGNEAGEPWPETHVTFLCQIVFFYVWKLLLKGYRKTLSLNDLWRLDRPEFSNYSYDSFVQIAGINRIRNSLCLALVRTHWQALIFSGILKLIGDLCVFVSPIIVGWLIELAQYQDQPPWRGYYFMGILFCAQFFRCVTNQYHYHIMNKIGVRIRAALAAAVYRKVLKLSPVSRRIFTSGEIQNLISVDVSRFCDDAAMFHLLWSAPFQLCLATYFLYRSVGHACWAGLGVVGIIMVINILTSKRFQMYLDRQMFEKDHRLGIVSEMVTNIKLIKLYAWELAFKSIVERIRKAEIKHLKIGSYFLVVSEIAWSSLTSLSCLAIFGVYTLINAPSPLTSEAAFLTITIFNMIYVPLLLMPIAVTSAFSVALSLRRLRDFLSAEELVKRNNGTALENGPPPETPLSITNASFSWDYSDDFALNDIQLNVRQRELVAVIGSVATGKSSLLNAIMGEMYLNCGTVSLKGTVALVPQHAWILNDTVRANILFGKEYDHERYESVIKNCALEPDMAILSDGDLTMIGERGVNLSGGQKQRISLARAVYQDCDIYLLDDPLSAVDARVGNHLFEYVIGPNGLLASKARILVTHSTTYLPSCDTIIVMENGNIVQMGPFSHINFNSNNGNGNQVNGTDTSQEVASDQKRKIVDQAETVIQNGSLPESTGLVPRSTSGNAPPLPQPDPIAPIVTDDAENEEELIEGNVPWSAYKLYIVSSGLPLLAYCILLCLAYSCGMAANFWLEKWTDENSKWNWTSDMPSPPTIDSEMGLGLYGSFVAAQILLSLCFVICYVIFSTRASRIIHDVLLNGTLRAPMSFFDATPVGRILSRLGKDINNIDNRIPAVLRQVAQFLALLVLTLIPSIYASPLFCVVIVPAMLAFYAIQKFYVKSSSQFRRIEAITRGPYYSFVQETLQGLDSIRAYRKTHAFRQKANTLLDANSRAQLTLMTADRWLTINLDFISNIMVTAAGICNVLNLTYGAITPGIMGMSMAIIISLTDIILWGAREMSSLQTEVVSLERINEYIHVKPEAPWSNPGDTLPDDWPQSGHVVLKNYSTKYRPELPPALADVNFEIKPGQKVAIVGRTGSGKSTLSLALFRLLESSGGSIIIDQIDIGTLGLHDLRGRLTIIPQEPCLFSGTLRWNLDPFDQYLDTELWSALELSRLKDDVQRLSGGLQYEVEEGGTNLSVGQRQLFCMARAILRRSRVLVLDEATASVDLQTDQWIQDTIRSQFNNCTVITIAHRLATIMDYDMVIVMNDGRVLETGSVPDLLANGQSYFFAIASEAGLI